MKILTKFALAAMMLITTLTAQAGWVSGYYRNSGTYVAPHYSSDYGSLGGDSSSAHVYHNPYATYPSVNVNGYYRSSATYVSPYVRTPANSTVTDNLSYRGYPSQQPGYVSPRTSPLDSGVSIPKTMPSYGNSGLGTGLLPYTGGYSPKALYGNSRSSGSGF